MAHAFSVKWIEAQKKSDKRQEIADASTKGLYLFVYPSGEKSFVYRYRSGDKLRKLNIGRYPDVSLEKARKAVSNAKELRADPIAPKDPKEDQKEKRLAKIKADNMQFRPTVERYLKEYAKERRSYLEKARLLGLKPDKDGNWIVRPGTPVAKWGKEPIDKISFDTIDAHLSRMADVTPFLANRTFAELRKFFNWLVSKRLLNPSPIAGMTSPKDNKFEKDRKRSRVLLYHKTVSGSSDDELRWLWQASDRIDANGTYPWGPFLKLLVLTGQRENELATMTWEQIDRQAREWIIPAATAKNNSTHLVPLSDAAMQILDSLPTSKGYVFTTTGSSPISGFSRMKKRLDKLMQEIANDERGEPVAIPAWRLHDLRRSCATGLQRLGIKVEVTEKVLNHTSGTFAGLVSVYQVDDYALDKEAAMQAWGEAVVRVAGGGTLLPPRKPVPAADNASNVVPMRIPA